VPEGPETRRAADRVERAIAGRKTSSVFFAFSHLKKYQRRLAGQRVTHVDTRGKAMLVGFENDLVIYSHNQLYGRWYVTPAGKMPDTGRTLRLAVHNEQKSALLYSASEIEVLRASELDLHPFLSKLGPDALDASLTEAALARRLADPKFARRQLAALLLDQGFVAGIGNYPTENRPENTSEINGLWRGGRDSNPGGPSLSPRNRQGLSRRARAHRVLMRSGKC